MKYFRTFSLIAFVGWLFIFSSTALGQPESVEAYLNRQRQIEEQIRLELDRQLPADQKVLVDFGGWLSGYLFLFDDGVRDRTLWRNDLRLWGSLNADEGIHQAYARMRLIYRDLTKDHGSRFDVDGWDGPDLDRGWYRLDLGRLLRLRGGVDVPGELIVKVGREYAMIGTGYVLSMPLDLVQITTGVGDLKFDGLLGKTVSGYPNIDPTRPRPDDSRRHFYGVQARYTGIDRHEPFVYYLWQRDRQHDGHPLFHLQEWRYDSEYLGVGSRGQLFQNWRYSGEMIYQHGKSFADRTIRRRESICAYGWDFLIEYLSPRPTKPRFALEYMFASGDPDRRFSPSGAAGGNRAYTTDHGFNAFGYRNTGLSLAPSLSNIHIWRAGASFFPWDSHRAEWLRELELGTDWFLYHKHRSGGGVSDPLANRQSGFVGWEMDYFVNWRFTTDLAWTLRYGVFFPGNAYSERSARHGLLTGLTWSF